MEYDKPLDDFQQQFLTSLLNGNKADCLKMTNEFLDSSSGINELYENLFRKVLYRVGILWENNQISVAKEHLATAVVESIMNSLYENILSHNKVKNKVIVTCAENEQHQVGAKMVSDIFEQNGWNSIFIGSSTPVNELFSFIDDEKPDVLCVSLSIYFNMRNLIKMTKQLNGRYPELTVLLGGQAFRHGIPDELLTESKNHLISNLQVLEDFINNLNRGQK